MATFVLVHGAWHGGWCWRNVADRLRAAGNAVFTPTLTGLGERAHLLSPAVALVTFALDVVNVIEAEELNEIVLVGHSFAGLPISVVADRMPGRLRHLIYLDATVLEDGQAPLDVLPPELVQARHRAASESSGGLSLPVPPAAVFGVTDASQVAWLERRLTPHPFRTFTDQQRLDHPVGNGVPRTYVACTNPLYAPLAEVRDRIRGRHGWQWAELATGHDAMVSAPDELTRLLLDAA